MSDDTFTECLADEINRLRAMADEINRLRARVARLTGALTVIENQREEPIAAARAVLALEEDQVEGT